jgi:methyl-accepting chemotaxis protein
MVAAAKLSIRAMLGLIIVGLAILPVILSVGALYDAFWANRAAETIASLTPINQHLFAVLQRTRNEAGDTLTTLKGEAPTAPAFVARVTAARHDAETNYEASLAGLVGIDLAGLSESVAQLKTAHDALQSLRPRVEAAFALTKTARDPRLVTEWPAATQSYLSAVEATSGLLEASFKLVDPVVDALLAVKRAAWSIRNFGGSTNLRIVAAMSGGQAWSPAEMLTTAEDRGRVAAAWAVVTEASARADTPRSVTGAIEKAKAYFTDPVLEQRNAAMQRLIAGQTADISVDGFLKGQLAALSAVADVASAALDEMVAHADRQQHHAARGLILNGLALVAALGFTAAGFAIVHRRVSRPIRTITAAMGRLANHDLTTDIPEAGRGDEIGEMSRAVVVFKDSMIAGDRLAAQQQAEQLRGEERQKTIEDSIQAFDRSIAELLTALSAASTELETTSRSMSATADVTTRQSHLVATASERASSNVQTVASAAEELSSSISEISRQMTESTRVAGQAVEQAERTNLDVRALADSAQKIGDVVKLINDIARQTNLLALNATIEAARAGDAGKGFAVVASEVKSLATQTARATEDIATQVAAIQAATGATVEAIQTIGQTIGRVNGIATSVASAVEEQGAATQEIARNVQQASIGTSEVSANIVGVSQAASETGTSSSNVLHAATGLVEISDALRREVTGFVARIRAA